MKNSQNSFIKKKKADQKRKKQQEKFQKKLEKAKIKKEVKNGLAPGESIDLMAEPNGLGVNAPELTTNDQSAISSETQTKNNQPDEERNR